MSLLLDTNVVSESIRARPEPKVLRWLAALPKQDLAISAVTVAELRDGITNAPGGKRRAALSRWVENEVAYFSDRTLQITGDILLDWISLSRRLRRTGKTRESADLLIASTARVHNLTLATRNIRDFADTGLVVYDPWHDRTHRMDAP